MSLITDKEKIKNYFVYYYEHIDELSAIIDPMKAYSDFGEDKTEEEIKEIKEAIIEIGKLFKKKGWEGDGAIGLIWIPPFIEIGNPEYTTGSYLWHVKQDNNGSSYIASEFPIKSERLAWQNK